ncbi:glycosyl transferase family 2 [Frondihabitans sp. PhB161]|nr:glycosyl transferase family 2 [Frondihabitans sp. PhB153]RPF05657.1 glycosyl transferase family 2 [Frondihabitans sp. PhB161]
MSSITAMCAVVPAHNEEGLIGACLEGLNAAARALHAARPDIALRIVVVADSCSDDTVAIATSFSGIEVLSSTGGTVGAARAEGIDHCLAALRGHADVGPLGLGVWIGNTDADSVVPRNWFVEQLRLADAGVDVMLGTVTPDFADLTEAQIAAWKAKRVPGKPNGHVHGANIGVRASAYLEAGGFLHHDEHEDNDLVTRLRAQGVTLAASDDCDVMTSGRQVGRTPGGYARYLAENLVPACVAPSF